MCEVTGPHTVRKRRLSRLEGDGVSTVDLRKTVVDRGLVEGSNLSPMDKPPSPTEWNKVYVPSGRDPRQSPKIP